MQPDQPQSRALGVHRDLGVSTIGVPAGFPQELQQHVIGAANPPGSTLESIGTQCVGHRIQQPGPVPLALSHRIHHELGDQRVTAGLGVGIIAGADGREPGEPPTSQRHQHPILRQRRTHDRLVPAVCHLGQIDCGEHAAGSLLWQMCYPCPPLQGGNGLCFGGQCQAYGICDHGGHGTHRRCWREPLLPVGTGRPR